MTPRGRQLKETSTVRETDSNKISKTDSPPLAPLPPTPPSKPMSKPVQRKTVDIDEGVKEVLGKKINTNDNITKYTKIVKSSEISLVRVRAPRIKIGCSNGWDSKGKKLLDAPSIKFGQLNINSTHQINHPPLCLDKGEDVKPPKPTIGQSQLVKTIQEILREPARHINPPPFSFGTSEADRQHNLNVLASHNMSLTKVIETAPFSLCSFGSEFRTVTSLGKNFSLHPKWERLINILAHGAEYPMVELEPSLRLQDLTEGLERGNHKGATIFQAELEKKFEKEIMHGWMLPLPKEAATLLPFAEYCPTSIVEQMTIDDMGTFIEKRRPIHDQSFLPSSSASSMNSRVHNELLDECRYGHMLLRLVHYILWLREHHPTTRILLSKTNLDSAYRRAHTNEQAVAKSLTWFHHCGSWMLLLCLRLTFGSTPRPSLFSVISESLTDLVNVILRCPDWDPATLSSPLQELYPPVQTLVDEISFARAKPLSITVPETCLAKADVFLDDIVKAGLDTPSIRKRVQGAVALAVETISRKVHADEPLPRAALINKTKLAAEGRLEEKKIVLGWMLDTRRLTISLPEHKFLAWTNQIKDIIESRKTTSKVLETILGRLTNASSILPLARHFYQDFGSFTQRWQSTRRTHSTGP